MESQQRHSNSALSLSDTVSVTGSNATTVNTELDPHQQSRHNTNVSYGPFALSEISLNAASVGIGFEALRNCTSSENTAVGFRAAVRMFNSHWMYCYRILFTVFFNGSRCSRS